MKNAATPKNTERAFQRVVDYFLGHTKPKPKNSGGPKPNMVKKPGVKSSRAKGKGDNL